MDDRTADTTRIACGKREAIAETIPSSALPGCHLDKVPRDAFKIHEMSMEMTPKEGPLAAGSAFRPGSIRAGRETRFSLILTKSGRESRPAEQEDGERKSDHGPDDATRTYMERTEPPARGDGSEERSCNRVHSSMILHESVAVC